MKKKISLLLAASIAIISILVGCARTEGKKDDDKTITFWLTSSLVGDEELEMEQKDWVIVQLLEEYMQIHQDVNIDLTYFEDDDLMMI